MAAPVTNTKLQTRIQNEIATLLSSSAFISATKALRILRTQLPRSSRISQSFQLVLKALLFVIFILNLRAIPGGWHWRVFWPVTKIRLQYLVARTQSSLALIGRTGKAKKEGMEIRMEKWLTSITPVGAHPFELQTRYKTWVSLDESDFNMHMSNSSYPKVLDCARMKAAMELFPQFLRVGGVIPLAATHFHFVRELPVFAKYELRLNIGAWDEKWMYVVGRFVTKGKTSKSNSSIKSPPNATTTSKNVTPAVTTLFEHAPINGTSESVSSSTEADTTPKFAYENVPSTATAEQLRNFDAAVASRLASDLGADNEEGLILHTVCVSRVCFKLGRITVPPAVLLATNGVSVHPWELSGSDTGTSEEGYSSTNPPATWTAESQPLFSKALGGSTRKLKEFYKGQWREVQAAGDDAIPWWERALGVGGIVDEKRKERLAVCSKLVGGMDGVRELC
ncbi:hypothetical protein BDP27DRAFT_1231108 [Rhodocollybia butyracea]|uniref:Uncharacterized protein n=1 Tax=Rhodocollybia butyracea TaxID=206335 RepID=A0A9P5PL87_9AGAR|nr:hypothetical protein BDP27DRAFT_1231108 [Rhodocollybia butyracea]